MKRIRRLALGVGAALVIGLLLSAHAFANGVPVRLFLNYVPDTSNWGPQTATGEAIVGVGDGFVQLSVQGLPQLTDERYTVWLVPVEGDAWVRMGDFNVEASGSADVGWSPDVFPYQAYRLIVLTVEPTPATGDTPGNRVSLVGHFPNAAAEPLPTTQTGEQAQPVKLPVTGAETTQRGLSLWGTLVVALSMLLLAGLGLGRWWAQRQERGETMIRGFYTAAADLEAEIARQGMMANNIANLNTHGYKQDVPTLETTLAQRLAMDTGPASDAPWVGDFSGQVSNPAPQIDLSQGPLEATYQDLDMAILGDGFLQVLTPDGVRYTRDGALTRDAAGRLVSADGYFVLGDGGPITLGNGPVAVAQDGTLYVNNAAVGRLALVRPGPAATIERLADNLMQFDQAEPVPAAQTHIRQGFLERSNVDASATVVGMMTTLRAYEASQRIMQMHDQTLQRVIELGRPA